MKIKNLGFLSLAVIFLPLIIVTAQVGGQLLWEKLCYGEVTLTQNQDSVLVSCYATQPPPTPTATSISTPTPTATVEPPDPTDIPGDPYEGAPLCSTHDDRAFHTLWNSQEGCHYNHPHGDSPHDVDDIFGTQIYDWMGGEISYPWQTFSDHGYENDLKHQGYIWLSRKPGDGSSIGDCYNPYGDGCVKAFRSISHFLMNDHGARTRYHSFLLEALICLESNPDDCGIIRTAGWHDTGDLFVDEVLVLDEPEPLTRSPRAVKLHNSGLPYAVWYPASAFARVSTAVDDGFGPVIVDGDEPYFWCLGTPGCDHNESEIQPHVINPMIGYREYTSDGVIRRLDQYLDPDGDGRANVSLFTDRYGRILVDGNAQPILDCEIGLDCIPLVFENVSMSWSGVNFQWRGDFRDYDVFFNGETSNWIKYFGPIE